MPVGLRAGNDASPTHSALDKPQEMTSALQTKASSLLAKEPSICPTDQESIIPGVRRTDRRGSGALEAQKKLDKRSWDYIVRSGVAGGIAGCAVSKNAVKCVQGEY